MKRIILKTGLYTVLILLCLEGIIRIFHLTKDYPKRYVDKFGVEKWVPNQNGYSVTGIRRQNFSEYHINNFGFNSYREFKPSYNTQEIALVGDSFIEGFHQNYYNSIGRKIENRLKDVQVFEFGYAGYDLADQLHLINAYNKMFEKIDYVYILLNFTDDLSRGTYEIKKERLKLESPLYKTLRKSKLIVYLYDIGSFSAVNSLLNQLTSFYKKVPAESKQKSQPKENETYEKRLDNFNSLVDLYGFDKKRYKFLLDTEKSPKKFLNYLNQNKFHYLDFGLMMDQSKKRTTLVYDMHWNDHGRDLIAGLIVNDFTNTLRNK
ncbi:hypothetical protein [Gaetbulibacter aestuarii]|uniref:SGNH/GDSL hydrolase family protein n=1 Tax=Gaetbulibacter aestuarii TaxID=1502358 RepID=A0ABW7N1E0_9FLAO